LTDSKGVIEGASTKLKAGVLGN